MSSLSPRFAWYSVLSRRIYDIQMNSWFSFDWVYWIANVFRWMCRDKAAYQATVRMLGNVRETCSFCSKRIFFLLFHAQSVPRLFHGKKEFFIIFHFRFPKVRPSTIKRSVLRWLCQCRLLPPLSISGRKQRLPLWILGGGRGIELWCNILNSCTCIPIHISEIYRQGVQVALWHLRSFSSGTKNFEYF